MSTPVPSGTLYASIDDLRSVLAGTDNGTGTAWQLNESQLTLALYSASNRVSVYAGSIYDGSSPAAVPPPILHDLTLDLAVFWATTTYMKNKAIEPTHPVYIKYSNAMSILQDVRAGKILLDPAPAPGIAANESGTVINLIPRVFTGADSGTRFDPMTGTVEPDTPLGEWAPMGMDWPGAGGALYQG